MNEKRIAPDRRDVLRAGALGTATALASPVLARGGFQNKTKHVILVAFAGGVRTRETLGTPENVPNLKRMSDEGVTYPRARTSNLGHFGATLSLFTGISEARGIRENTRGEDPTVFEYVRKDLALSSSEVWVSTSGGTQQSNYSASYHREYGPQYGANTLDGDGIFNAEFKSILDSLGRPREMKSRELELLEKMRASIGTGAKDQGVNTPETFAKVERYILDELKGGTADLRGTGSSDAKALRVARNLLPVFRPRLLGVVLRDADVAHRNFNAYVEVIRRNDVMLGELWAAVQSDPELAESTSIFVVPEFGRDADLNSRRGLDHGDGSDDLNYVPLVCWGPDFAGSRTVLEEVRTIDVCASVCGLLGAKARYARSRHLPRLMG